MIGYKLFRQRKDGTLGPLFINRRQRLTIGETYIAEEHPTKGFAFRPGWHICSEMNARILVRKSVYGQRLVFQSIQVTNVLIHKADFGILLIR